MPALLRGLLRYTARQISLANTEFKNRTHSKALARQIENGAPGLYLFGAANRFAARRRGTRLMKFNIGLRGFAGGAALAVAACATHHPGFDAYGYLSPNPTAQGELIGHFESLPECEAAAEEWTTRQVVGNPVHAECFPVDRR